MRYMKASRLLVNSLKLLLTILLLYLVFQSVDLSKISHHLKTFSLKSLIFLLLACWAGQLLCSERWRIFATSLQMQGSYRSFVQMYFAGMFFNIGLPSLIGGDVVKAYVVSRKCGKPLQIGFASVLQDRAAGLISLLVYGSLAILIYPLSWRGFPLWAAYALSWAAVAVTLWLDAKGEGIYSRFIVPHSRTFVQRMLKALAEFHQALGISRLRPEAVLRVTLYSFLNSGLILWILQQVTVAAGHPVGVIPFSALFPLVTLATMLPVTLSGLGVREWFYVEALSLVGIPRDQGLVISLATSALLLLCNLAGILFIPGVPKELRPQAHDFSENARARDIAEHRNSKRNDVI